MRRSPLFASASIPSAPLGATIINDAVAFSVNSSTAVKVRILLYKDDVARNPCFELELIRTSQFLWQGAIKGARAGMLYGYRIETRQQLLAQDECLAVDPYAKAVWPLHDGTLLAVIVDDAFDWTDAHRTTYSFQDTIIYEAHCKGFTAHDTSGVMSPGTYRGFIEKIPYLQSLGITAVEFLPLHQSVPEPFLVEAGRTNYWGYSTLSYFAPDYRFVSANDPMAAVRECKEMINALHNAGLEVILDVVYNHTCEGNETGPLFSFKILDKEAYYIHDAETGALTDLTGCGNTLDAGSYPVIKLIMDSLRYWVTVMHVDGFRFDLATTLGRPAAKPFDPASALLTAIRQDPIVGMVKLIAEPWDATPQVYKPGKFPNPLYEWNGLYRDSVRRFCKSDAGLALAFIEAICNKVTVPASNSDIRFRSINFITAHDGFTLWDLVSYARKHNEENGQKNSDGTNANYSWNWGIEGETSDPVILEQRSLLCRNFMLTLCLSAGVPMILMGDEVHRSQLGNNNAYCQDVSWNYLSWKNGAFQTSMLIFTKASLKLRKYLIERYQDFFNIDANPALAFFDENGISPVALGESQARSVEILCVPCTILHDSCALLICSNAHWESRDFTFPQNENEGEWYQLVDTSRPDICNGVFSMRRWAGTQATISARSTMVFERRKS